MNEKISNPMYALRQIHCISIRNVKEQTGISVNTVLALEHGRTERIQARTLRKLKERYQIDSLQFVKDYIEWKQLKENHQQ
jgi:transcriptional regulator with XRE-family HTH domain